MTKHSHSEKIVAARLDRLNPILKMQELLVANAHIISCFLQQFRNSGADANDCSSTAEVVDSLQRLRKISVNADENRKIVVPRCCVVDQVRCQESIYAFLLEVPTVVGNGMAKDDADILEDVRPMDQEHFIVVPLL